MKKKSISTIDKVIGIVCFTFVGYIVFLAVSEEGLKAGLLIIGKILGVALAATLIGMILVSLVVWAVFAWRRRQRVLEIEREVFSQAVLENQHKKEGIDMSCPGPNKFAR